jgi:hypothetical protein
MTRQVRHARAEFHGRGTRFRIFPQSPAANSHLEPETVWISHPPVFIKPGPSDSRMYVIDAIDKKRHYDYPFMPPWTGPAAPPVAPGPDGHFDHLEPYTREFMAAHMYGTIRFVLDVWEQYFGGELPWHFSRDQDRLELIPVVDWNNAHSGYGFIETGFSDPASASPEPFCLNFDVLAHELGHSFVYQLLGTPPENQLTAEYLAFHESAADCVAMIACLDFDSVIDRLLERTRGNIYLPNELNRIGEISETEQLRNASQSVMLADIPDLRTSVRRLSQPERHRMSLPLTGAVFDILVEMFQALLVRDGLIAPSLDALSRQEDNPPKEFIQAEFDRAYEGRHEEFKALLLDARDYVGNCLAETWKNLTWDVSFSRVAGAFLKADHTLYGGSGREIILEEFAWRGITMPFRGVQASFFHRIAGRQQGSR